MCVHSKYLLFKAKIDNKHYHSFWTYKISHKPLTHNSDLPKLNFNYLWKGYFVYYCVLENLTLVVSDVGGSQGKSWSPSVELMPANRLCSKKRSMPITILLPQSPVKPWLSYSQSRSPQPCPSRITRMSFWSCYLLLLFIMLQIHFSNILWCLKKRHGNFRTFV